jgi:hypothetical protein
VFLYRKQFSHEILPNLVEKTKQVYVLPKLLDCVSAMARFYLWMSKDVYDIFTLVIKNLSFNWQPK